MQHQLDSRFKTLKSFIDTSCSSQAPEDIKSYLFRFGAVLICGNIERCTEIIILDRLTRKAHPKIINFVKSHFARGINFDCNAIYQLLIRFDTAWGKKFETFVTSNQDVKEGVSSLYAIRNSVAHGGSGSVASKRLLELYDVSERLIAATVIATQ